MRVFIFLSRFTFICNLAFLLFVFFRWMEHRKPVSAGGDRVVAVPFFKDIIIILGVSALVINLLMCVFLLFFLLRKKAGNIPLRLPAINFMFLLLQVWYFFFYND